MAERNQLLQYTPLVGPVWREPVAEKLAWLPAGRWQPALSLPRSQPPPRGFALVEVSAAFDPQTLDWLPRGSAPRLPDDLRRIGGFARPEFAALYKPEELQWSPADRYAGRAAPREQVRWYVLDPIPPAAPQYLTWAPVDRYTSRQLPRSQRDFTVWPPFEPLYDPEGLQWSPRGQQPVRGLTPNKLSDYSSFVQLVATPAFDPQNLDWMPRGAAPQIPLERRRLGDFQQPSVSALYDPQRLEWISADRYAGRPLPRARGDQTVLVQLVVAPAFDPQDLEWQPRDSYRGWPLRRALIDRSVYQGEPIVLPAPPVVVIPPAGGDSGRLRLRRRPLYYWEAAKLGQMALREVEESLTEELAYAEATLPRSRDDFYDRINHIKEIGRRLDSIRIYRDLARRVESVVTRMEETRIAALADTSEEDEINDLIQFL